jgi:O-antigen/teichoic acid export membrane protein
MKNGSTLFLKALIILIGLAVLGVCIILCGVMIGGHPGMYIPVMLVMLATAVPFFLCVVSGFQVIAMDRHE